jgi:hypothetical protein
VTITSRGRDLLGAAAATSAVFGVTGPPIAAALGLSLSVMAAASLALFWYRFRRAGVSTEVRRLRVFKRESGAFPIRVRPGSSRWVRLVSVSLEDRPGLDCEVRRLDGDGDPEMVLTPSLAGRSEGLVAKVRGTDPLGLFTMVRGTELGLVLESLPLALRTPARPLRVSLLSFGENPAGRPGAGQELYAVGEFQPGMDPRDIMWKRAAEATEETALPVRVREINVRKVVSIGVLVGSGSEDERARRGDLVSEAIAQVGVQVIRIGTALEIVGCPPPSGVRRATASTVAELADVTSSTWVGGGAGTPIRTPSGSSSFDLLIVGPQEVGPGALPPFRLLLVVSDEGSDGAHSLPISPPSSSFRHLPRGASVFTGKEDLSGLTSSVIAG